jgi:hypothetical protein
MTDDTLRVEALKLAYDVSLKTEELSKHKSPEDRCKALEELITLAKFNFKFIKEGDVSLNEFFPSDS